MIETIWHNGNPFATKETKNMSENFEIVKIPNKESKCKYDSVFDKLKTGEAIKVKKEDGKKWESAMRSYKRRHNIKAIVRQLSQENHFLVWFEFKK